MLLSLRSHISVTLYLDRLVIVRTGRGWRPQSAKPVTLFFEQSEDKPIWDAPLSAFNHWLQQNNASKSSLEIILSDSFVRYAIIPWSNEVQKPSEIEALARIQLESLYGAQSGEWAIKATHTDYAQPIIASAFDKRLLMAIKELCRVQKLSLASIKPYSLNVFNHWHKQINKNALLAVLESNQCILASFRNGQWNSIRSMRIAKVNEENALSLVERELVLQGLGDKTTIYIHCAENVPAALFLEKPGIVLLKSRQDKLSTNTVLEKAA